MLKLNRDDVLKLFATKDRKRIMPTLEGRFILPIPYLNDGKGDIVCPNVKEISAKILGGRKGEVTLMQCEANPQHVPTDGTQVIVINRIDKHLEQALISKLNELRDTYHGTTREVIEEFLSYVRGYEYNAQENTVTLSPRSAGFHCDNYFMPIEDAKALHFDPADPDKNLNELNSLMPKRYVKRRGQTSGVFIDGPVRYMKGDQEFPDGAMVQITDPSPDFGIKITFVHPSDINSCYRNLDRSSLVDEHGKIDLPIYKTQDLQTELTLLHKGLSK